MHHTHIADVDARIIEGARHGLTHERREVAALTGEVPREVRLVAAQHEDRFAHHGARGYYPRGRKPPAAWIETRDGGHARALTMITPPLANPRRGPS